MVLHPLDLEIHDRELFFLVGPSGCGKSTLLRLIAGLLKPDSGRISFDTKEVSSLPPEKRGAAMVFQNYALWPHMSVCENVAFGLQNFGFKGDKLLSTTNEALESVGMLTYSDRMPAALSGGQQQRVALARALAVKPSLLLFDEPLSNLDARLREHMRSEIWRICKENSLTAIYVTHDRKEALSMADRIAILDKGRLRQIGTPEELYKNPLDQFTASFMGDCNFFEGEILPGSSASFHDIRTALGIFRVPVAEAPPGKRLKLAARPEDVKIMDLFNDSSVEGLIKRSVFVGDITLNEIEAGGISISAAELGYRIRKGGGKCAVSLSPDKLMILRDQEN